MKNNFLLFIFMITLGLVACSSTKKDQGPSEMVVSLDDDGGQGVSWGHDLQKQNILGPMPEGGPEQTLNQAPGRLPVVAVILGPGLNRTIGYLSFFKIMQKNHIPIHIIAGSEMAAIIAAWYAKSMAPGKIEWMFYQYWQEAKKSNPYTGPWLKTVKNIFLNSLKDETIEGQKITLVLAVFDDQERKVKYLQRGNLFSALVSNITLSGSSRNKEYSTPFHWEVFNRQILEKYGADLVIGLDVLGKNPSFKSQNDFLVGIYGKAAWITQKEQNNVDLFLTLPITEMPLDSQDDLTSYTQRCDQASEIFSQKIIDKIKTWQESNTQ
jgi:hypothetical protein